jgi:exonuclease III
MKLCGLNCHGLKNRLAVRALQDLERQIKPDVFFLSETHLGRAKADNLRRKLSFDSLSLFESDGQSGGLLMMWRNNVKVIEKSVTKNYIDVIIEDDISWRFT